MSSGALTQEEIDALLRSGNGSSPSPAGAEVSVLSDFECDTLGEIGNISFGSAATVLSTLLQQKVDITTPQVSVLRRDELLELFPIPHVAVGVEYTDGFEGMNVLAIRIQDAQIIADLMLGGDGQGVSGDLNELHLSAVSECMNQMMGSAATSMSTLFNRMVNISPPTVSVFNLSEDFERAFFSGTDQPLVKVSFRLIVGTLIDSHIMQLVPFRFAKSMIQSLIGDMAPATPTGTTSVTGESMRAGHVASNSALGAPSGPTAVTQLPAYTHSGGNTVYDEAAAASYAPPISDSHSMRSHPALPSGGHTSVARQAVVQQAAFSPLDATRHQRPDANNLDLLMDIPLSVTVELGRTKRLIRDILAMGQGSVIELDKLAGEPVDILVNNKLVARGEVVVIDDKFGVRVTDIISPSERINNLRG